MNKTNIFLLICFTLFLILTILSKVLGWGKMSLNEFETFIKWHYSLFFLFYIFIIREKYFLYKNYKSFRVFSLSPRNLVIKELLFILLKKKTVIFILITNIFYLLNLDFVVISEIFFLFILNFGILINLTIFISIRYLISYFVDNSNSLVIAFYFFIIPCFFDFFDRYLFWSVGLFRPYFDKDILGLIINSLLLLGTFFLIKYNLRWHYLIKKQ
jgi:hypothetical protein